MPSQREIRRRIGSVKNIKQITRAMQFVAASKLKRAQDATLQARPYQEKLEEVLADVASVLSGEEHPLLARAEGGTRLLILFTTDRGLAGSLNTNTVRHAARVVAESTGDLRVVTVGRKGNVAMRRAGVPVAAAFEGFGDKPTFADVLPLARLVTDDYLAGVYTRVDLIHPTFVSTLVQRPTVESLLPIEPSEDTQGIPGNQFIFEPSAAAVLQQLLPRYVATRLFQAVRDGKACAMVSAGNTGATMASALLRMKRLPGVFRPAIATPIPNPGGGTPTILLDAGANAECSPEWLVQFAQMGTTFARTRYGIDQPKVGLLSIGEEPTKGSPLVKETHALLAEGSWTESCGGTFVGNVEGRDIMSPDVDVIVTDGFTGNVVLKTLEGSMRSLVNAILATFGTSDETKAAGDVLFPALLPLYAQLDPNTTGGAMLLGLNGVCIISHGSSNDTAIVNAVKVATEMVDADLVGAVARTIRSGRFRCTVDRAFREVMAACADRPEGTWITPGLIEGYSRLHDLGWAHSVEAWTADGELAGGVYGVQVGRMFGAESMFHRVRDASKVALVALVDRLHLHGGLVRLNLGDHVAGADLVAGLHVPLRKLAFLHGRRQRRHQDRSGHGLAPVADGLDGRHDFVDGRQGQLFKIGRVGHRHVLARHARRRRIEIVEGLFHHLRADLGRNTANRPSFFHGDDTVRLFHGCDDRLGVERPEASQVDHFHRNALLGQDFDRLQHHAHRDGI